MKLSEMSLEQQEAKRKYDREAKRKSRAKRRTEPIPTADEWSWNWAEHFPQEYAELKTYKQEFSAKVYEELGRGEYRPHDSPEDETFSWVATALFCLKKNTSPWVREVEVPAGVLVGGLFYPEALGSGLVENTHHFGLEASAIYAAAYRELLHNLDEKFGDEHTEHARDIKTELAGEYVLKLPEPITDESDQKPQTSGEGVV